MIRWCVWCKSWNGRIVAKEDQIKIAFIAKGIKNTSFWSLMWGRTYVYIPCKFWWINDWYWVHYLGNIYGFVCLHLQKPLQMWVSSKDRGIVWKTSSGYWKPVLVWLFKRRLGYMEMLVDVDRRLPASVGIFLG